MSSRERIGSSGTRVLSTIIVVLGLVIVVRTVAAGGDVLSVGVLIGLVFVAIGSARLYLAAHGRR